MLGLILFAYSFDDGILVKFNSNGQRVCTNNCGKAFENGCPEITCPRPPLNILDKSCQIPSCLIAEAKWHLWPVHEDPTSFWQCPHVGIWSPIKRECGCATLFDYQKQRCVHPHEYKAQCVGHPDNPQPKECPICKNCVDEIPSPSPTLPTAPTRGPTFLPNLCFCYPFTCFCNSNSIPNMYK